MKVLPSVEVLWADLKKHDPKAIRFLPDLFLFRAPPREYFFKVLFVTHPKEYDEFYQLVRNKIGQKSKANPSLIVKPHFLTEMMENYRPETHPILMRRLISEEKRKNKQRLGIHPKG